ncbi:MAG: cbb3-type cytochrome c oxidase subunit 3 [Paracoccaceae bacterium]
METYSLLREVADSWVLLAMFGFFISAGIWAFLPSQKGAREEASMIPLRNDQDAKTCTGIDPACDDANTPAKLEGRTNV